MPKEQETQIERREPSDISRRSENARRGMNAADYVAGQAKADSGLRSIVLTDVTYEFALNWGTEGEGDRQFDDPHSVAVASDGGVYVADLYNHRIQKFTSEGMFVSKWGKGGSGDGQYSGASGVSVESDGSVYVVDSDNNCIQKFSLIRN